MDDKYNEFEGLDPQSVQSVLQEQELMRFVVELMDTPDRFTQEEQDKINALILKLYTERTKYIMQNNNLMVQFKILTDKLELKDKDIEEIRAVTIDKETNYFVDIITTNSQITNKLKEELADKDKQISILMDLLQQAKK